VEIVCGPQGLQHIWTAVRARGLGNTKVSIRINMTYADQGGMVCGQGIDSVTLPARGDFGEYAGIICFIPDPDIVRGQSVILRGDVMDMSGGTGTAQVEVVPFGPTMVCGAGGGGDGGVTGGADGG
jgi:hypothetical protein